MKGLIISSKITNYDVDIPIEEFNIHNIFTNHGVKHDELVRIQQTVMALNEEFNNFAYRFYKREGNLE